MKRIANWAYYVLAWAFVACLTAQVFLAGLATFDDSGYWDNHVAFVRMFAMLPVLMLVLSLIARLPWKTVLLTAGLFVLIIFQFVSVNLDARYLAALHPVVAILLIVGAISAIRRSKPA